LFFTKWCDDCTEVLTFLLVKFECILLHTNIKFCEKHVPRMLAQNIRLRQMTLFN
jgi:hypothetical protein